MHTIYTWFYCLPISNIVCFLLVLSILYFYLRCRFKKQRLWKLSKALLLIVCLAIVVSVTLVNRSSILYRPELELLPFHSYRAVIGGENPELLRSNFMNVILFYPVGLLGCDVLPTSCSRKRRVFVVAMLCVLLSLGIECLQYLFALGQAEADDVIHNGLGAFLGGTVCAFFSRRTSSHKTEQNNAP